MGGLAMRAPVLAALFLVVTMALLAMPGTANFIGEFYILNGVFQEKVVFALVASVAIAMAAYYALRLFQHAMHYRKRDDVESREIGWREGAIVGGLVACIVALAFYPGVVLERSDESVKEQLGAVSRSAPVAQSGDSSFRPQGNPE
jgi:NADH-quinone oxidoreductase subunit M